MVEFLRYIRGFDLCVAGMRRFNSDAVVLEIVRLHVGAVRDCESPMNSGAEVPISLAVNRDCVGGVIQQLTRAVVAQLQLAIIDPNTVPIKFEHFGYSF